MTTAINLAELPPPEVLASLDFEVILVEYKDYFLSIYPEAADVIDLESEPLHKAMQLGAWRELQLRARYNDEARALMLAYATGADLDHIGFTYYRRETRLVVIAADDEALPPIEEVLENDDDFRERLPLKLESYSTAGPTGAYSYHARSADGLIKDASTTSPYPGTSLVTVLSKEGNGVATQAMLEVVEAALNTDEIRPLCEEVQVQAADIIEYTLAVGLWTYAGPDTALVADQAQAGLVAYTDLHHRLDHNHTLTGLSSAAHVAGVQKVELNLIADIVTTKAQAAYCTSITVTHLGVAI